MSFLVWDTFSLSVYAKYDTEARALRALSNAIDKGWKLQGRRYMATTLERLVVGPIEMHAAADTEVIVYNILNPDGEGVKIKRSQKGNPVYDPSTEGYHSM